MSIKIKRRFLADCFKVLFACILMNAICPQNAYAYLDPGTGSMILQVILAGIVGIGCTFKVWKQKLTDCIKKVKDGRNKKTNGGGS